MFYLRASLQHHQPKEIYDYLLNHVGEVTLKIKKRHVIVTLYSQEAYNQVIEKMKAIKLFGKKLEFFPYELGEELPEEQDGNVSNAIVEEVSQASGQVFVAQNELDQLIHEESMKLERNLKQSYEELVKLSRDKVSKLELEIKEEDPKRRELKALTDGARKKFQEASNKLALGTKKVKEFIEKFVTKPDEIELEPTFRVNNDFSFPDISLDDSQFSSYRHYINTPASTCKRMCAINGSEFAITCGDTISLLKGCLKIYDVNDSYPKETLQLDDGGSGVSILGSLIVVGTQLGNFNTIQLNNPVHQPHHEGKILRKHEKMPSEMVEVKKVHHETRSKFLTLCRDNVIRQYDVVEEEIIIGDPDISYEETYSIDCRQPCEAMEVLQGNVMVYGVENKLYRCLLDAERHREVKIKGFPTRIKRHSQYLFAVAIGKGIEMVDTRSDSIVQKFVNVDTKITALESIGDHCLFYGCHGQVGMLDDRRSQFVRWNDSKLHQSNVTDILKLQSQIVSCDVKGNIFSWKLGE